MKITIHFKDPRVAPAIVEADATDLLGGSILVLKTIDPVLGTILKTVNYPLLNNVRDWEEELKPDM
jgi:hypothetical protein